MSSFESDPSAWSSINTRNPSTPMAVETRSVSVDVKPNVRAFVGVTEVEGQPWAKIEFNPSRVVDPDGHSLCPVVELPGAVALVVNQAAEVVGVPDEVGEMRVKRIDVARDFTGVDRPDFYVRGLGPVKRPWARRNGVYFDPSRNGAQTLHVGSGAGSVRLYDKDAESGGNAPGVLRWEVEARASWAQNYGGMKVLGDVSTETVGRLAANRWEWSAMGVEVTATERVLEAVQRSGLTPAKQRSFLGHLLLQAHGMASPLSNDTASEFNRLQRGLGVVLTPDTDGAGFVGRLDWESGREVVRVA